jgi:hypothetical protein
VVIGRDEVRRRARRMNGYERVGVTVGCDSMSRLILRKEPCGRPVRSQDDAIINEDVESLTRTWDAEKVSQSFARLND